MWQKKPYACSDQKSGCRRGNPAEDVPEDRQMSIFEEEQADRETDYPWDDEKARNRCNRSDCAPHLCPDADGETDDVRPGHKLAKAYDIREFAVSEPATLLDSDAARPDNPSAAADTAQRNTEKRIEQSGQGYRWLELWLLHNVSHRELPTYESFAYAYARGEA